MQTFALRMKTLTFRTTDLQNSANILTKDGGFIVSCTRISRSRSFVSLHHHRFCLLNTADVHTVFFLTPLGLCRGLLVVSMVRGEKYQCVTAAQARNMRVLALYMILEAEAGAQ